ncbi:c-type lectin domain-containing protein [Nephila pilipes]|uniref:C-type lectin domain-containing protein n=1 Tax=Nephila pilipes TaxID=299642 RepID=A0A8X6UA70_NEPPI|nr:c-type lectin domain-containing protein [Nephila pilipes]
MLRALEAMTTPMTTLPPTTPPPLNAFYLKYAASQHRQDKKLEAKPIAVVKDVSRIHCLSLCLQRQTGGKSKICRSFNWADRTCYMLNTYVCDGEKELTVAPGYSYFDLVDSFAKEREFIISKQCSSKGKCSNKCLKFRLFKTPLSWQEAHAACRAEEAFLAMPKTWNDHETLIALMKKGNILQSWIGIRKRDGIFYYDNGGLLGQNNTFWGPDQPNDSGGTQQCVQMMSEMEYLWNDFDCARPVGFVCQYVW